MDVTPLIASDRQVIQSYGAQGFRVSGQSWAGAIIVFPDRTEAWADAAIDALPARDFGEVDVLLLGCGLRGALVPAAVKTALKARGTIIEAMDTGAACRTYNVLMADGRRVAAALMPPV